MKKKISTDLSKLTNVDEKIVNKILNLIGYLIGNSLYEAQLNKDDLVELDMGFGELLIKNESDNLKMKFLPNDVLELDLKGVTHGDKPALKKNLEKALTAKLTEIYKEIM